MKKMPKTLFVMRNNEGTDDEYLSAETEIGEFGDDGVVAIYQLKEVKKRRTEYHVE